jgi:hypothetical protein
MAVQILSYMGLLYQDLIRSGQLMASGQIPPVLPLVLYNGVRCWQAPEEAPAAGIYGVVEAGIFAWTAQTLLLWGERVLTVQILADVFEA